MGCCQRPSEGGDGGQEPGETRGQRPRPRGSQGQCCAGNSETARMPGKERERQEGGAEGLVGAGRGAPGQGWSLCSRQGCGHATGDSEGAASGPPRKGVPQTGTQCDDSKGQGGPSLGMFKVLASPAFPCSSTEALRQQGSGSGAGRALQTRTKTARGKNARPGRLVEPGRVPRAARSRVVPWGAHTARPERGGGGDKCDQGCADRGAAGTLSGLRHAYSAPE